MGIERRFWGKSESCTGPNTFLQDQPWRQLLAQRGPEKDAPNLHLRRWVITWQGSIVIANAGSTGTVTLWLPALVTNITLTVPNLPQVIKESFTKLLERYRLDHLGCVPQSFYSTGGSAMARDPAVLTTGKSVSVTGSSTTTVNFYIEIPIEWGRPHAAEEDDFLHPVGLFRDCAPQLTVGTLNNCLLNPSGGSTMTVQSLSSTFLPRWDMVGLPWVQLSAWTTFEFFQITSGNTKPTNVPLIDGEIIAMGIVPASDTALFSTSDVNTMGLKIGSELLNDDSDSILGWYSDFYRDNPTVNGQTQPVPHTIAATEYSAPIPIIGPVVQTRGQSLATAVRYALNEVQFKFDTVSQSLYLLRTIVRSHTENDSVILSMLGLPPPADGGAAKMRSGKRGTINAMVANVAPIKLPSPPATLSAADMAGATRAATMPAMVVAPSRPAMKKKVMVRR